MLHSPVKTVCSCRPLPFSIPGREQSGANPPQSRINPGFFKTFRTLLQQHLFNEFYARDISFLHSAKPFYFNVKNLAKIIFCYFDVINLLPGHKYDILDMNREGNDYAEANAEKA